MLQVDALVVCAPEERCLLLLLPILRVIVRCCDAPQICVRDVTKKRSFELEKHTAMVTDYDGERYHGVPLCVVVTLYPRSALVFLCAGIISSGCNNAPGPSLCKLVIQAR